MLTATNPLGIVAYCRPPNGSIPCVHDLLDRNSAILFAESELLVSCVLRSNFIPKSPTFTAGLPYTLAEDLYIA